MLKDSRKCQRSKGQVAPIEGSYTLARNAAVPPVEGQKSRSKVMWQWKRLSGATWWILDELVMPLVDRSRTSIIQIRASIFKIVSNEG